MNTLGDGERLQAKVWTLTTDQVTATSILDFQPPELLTKGPFTLSCLWNLSNTALSKTMAVLLFVAYSN